MTKFETAKNASGDRFAIEWLEGQWRATQIDGLQNNYLSLPAMLRAQSRRALIADLSSHYSNA